MEDTDYRLEMTISDKHYAFRCENNVPIDHIKEALFQFQRYIGNLEQDLKSKQAIEEASVAPEVIVEENSAPAEVISEDVQV